MKSGIEKNFKGFATIAPDGSLEGPWNPWLHWPRIGGRGPAERSSLCRNTRRPFSRS